MIQQNTMEQEDVLLLKCKETNLMIDDIIEYDKSDTEIWVSNWVFYNLDNSEFIVNDVVCLRIPIIYHLKDLIAYKRAIKNISITTTKTLQKDKKTETLKFKIIYIKLIGKRNK